VFYIVVFGPVSRFRSPSVFFLAAWGASASVCFNPLQALPPSIFFSSWFGFIPGSSPVQKQQLPPVLESLLIPSSFRFLHFHRISLLQVESFLP
jgi:hypothetical protein